MEHDVGWVPDRDAVKLLRGGGGEAAEEREDGAE